MECSKSAAAVIKSSLVTAHRSPFSNPYSRVGVVTVNATACSCVPPGPFSIAPKPDKEIGPHREGLIDLEIGVPPADAAPELRIQALFHDHFVGVARAGHPLLDRPITPESYAACSHVVVTRRGQARGLVDAGLAAFHLERKIMAVVTSFPAAVAIAGGTDLVALVPSWFTAKMPDSLVSFELPVQTTEIVVSQLWHPRLDADPAHRWLRGLVQAACKDLTPATPDDSRPPR